MTSELSNLRDAFVTIQKDASAFFDEANSSIDAPHYLSSADPDELWNKLSSHLQEKSLSLQKEILKLVGKVAAHVKRATLLTEADERDLKRSAKEIRAALRLHSFQSWDTEILNNEDVVLGVRPAGQSESYPAWPDGANRAFLRAMDTVAGIFELLEASPESPSESGLSLSGATKYRPNTVFVMMWIDPSNPALEDIYDTVKTSCAKFGLKAIRADEIEHEEVITEKILAEIKTSEFLIADLTGERPSVYYEIGYAHSLGRRVIMYRQQGVRIHFDLAAYNCPEYRNNSDLREKLLRRLEEVTNRRGSGS